ncbi:MAG: hypothetical protein NUV87_04015 [Candidatus Roizmanbacteria bacterium]|nr:hypothetical protein [Candidatus Roizmanbacteria bacterium]
MTKIDDLHNFQLSSLGFSQGEIINLNKYRKDYIRRIYIEPIKTFINEGLGVALIFGLPKVADFIDANYPLEGQVKIATNILRFTAQIAPYLMVGEGLRLAYNEAVGWKNMKSYNRTIQERSKSNSK